jgi:hypothetical protein
MLRQARLPHQALFARGLAMSRIGRLLLMVGVLTWLAAPAAAQRGWQPPKLPEIPVSKTGTIEAVNGLVIQVMTDDNQTWYLQVKPITKVKVTGKGKANSLVKGQNVSFSASGSGKMEKISTLSVVLASGQMGMGIGPAPNVGPGPKPGSKLGKNPGGADLTGADAGGSSDGSGVVNKVTKSAVQLMVNGKKRSYELPDDLEVTFDMDGPAALEFVPQGAKIDFKGKAQGNFPRAVVDDVKIEVVPVEGRTGKKPVHKPLHAKPKKGGDDQPDAAAGTDDEPKKPVRKTHKKPEKPDTGDEKPADSSDAPAK